jgi:lysophospholipase L1-like esterase
VQSTWFRLVAGLTTLILFVGVLEIAVRLIGIDVYFQNRFFVLNRALDYPDVFMKDPYLFWRLRPSRTVTSRFFEGQSYRINSMGLRDDEISRVKTKTRILVLGNSCTFGWGVTEEETYARRLGTLLEGEYDVINAGVPGYSTEQGKRFFQQELLELKPDIVTMMYAWNDHWAASNGIADKDQEFPPALVLAIQNQLARLHSYRLLKKALLSQLEPHPDSLWSPDSVVYRVSYQDFADNLAEICHLCRANDITPILLTSPAPSLSRYGQKRGWAPAVRFHHIYNWQIRETAEKLGVPLVDAAVELDHHDGMYDDVRHDFIHFNAAGHAIIAEMLAAEVEAIENKRAIEHWR